MSNADATRNPDAILGPEHNPSDGSMDLKTGWGWILAYAVLVIAIGILALVNPIATGFATGVLVGGMLLVYGVMAIAAGLSALSNRGRWIELLLGILALIAGVAFMAAYTASHAFPFSVALSYSRRVYLIGTYLTFVVTALGYSAMAMLAYWIERTTDGFGRHLYIFGIPGFENYGGVFGIGAAASVLVLFFMCFGFFWAILYRRVSIPILWAVIIAVIAGVLGVVALITINDGWPTVGLWFMEQTAFSLAAWGLLATIVLGALNYWLIRRATVS